MKKLKLDLDALTVKSFATNAEPDAAARGTIRAHSTPVTTITIPVTAKTISYLLCEEADQAQAGYEDEQYEQPAEY